MEFLFSILAWLVKTFPIFVKIYTGIYRWVRRHQSTELDEAEVFEEMSSAIKQPQVIAIRISVKDSCQRIDSAFKHAISFNDIPDHTVLIEPTLALLQKSKQEFFKNGVYGLDVDGKEILTSEIIVFDKRPWKYTFDGLFILCKIPHYDCLKEFRRLDEMVLSDFSYLKAFIVRRTKDSYTGVMVDRYFGCSSRFAIKRLKDIRNHLPSCVARASIGSTATEVDYKPSKEAFEKVFK